MNIHELVGILAGILTTIAYLPQTIHTIKTKDVTGISLGMYYILTIGIILWLLYGIHLHSFPLILSNIITLGFTGTILFLKLKRNKRN